jgi:tetratricopeptide (TPR) repeat protein
VLVVLIAATMIAYLPALKSGYIWDDDEYLTNNPVLLTPAGLRAIWFTLGATPQYYPMVFTTFWVEHKLWGLNPAGFHTVNVLLHAFSAFLLWRILVRLKVPGALLGALIFALHPVQVESVAWITERKNILSGFFYFLAMRAYLKFDPIDRPESRLGVHLPCYLLAFVFFAAALFSKTVTCSLPAAIFLVYWWKRDKLRPIDSIGLVPMLMLGLVMARVTMTMEHEVVGTRDIPLGLSAMGRVLLAGRAIWFYLSKVIWPHPLIFFYEKWAVDTRDWVQYLCPAAVLAVVTCLWLARRRIGKGPLVAALFFIATLFPALGFVDVYPMRFSWVADHFQYLACIGPIVGIAALFSRSTQRLPRAGIFASLALMAVLGTLTWRQCGMYRDSLTLWTATVKKNPGSSFAQYNLGVLLRESNRSTEALQHIQASLRAAPDLPEPHLELGYLAAQSSDLAGSIEHFREAIRLKPDYAEALNNLAVQLIVSGRKEEALSHLRQSVQYKPNYRDARNNLGRLLAEFGKVDEAREQFRAVLKKYPNDPQALDGLRRLNSLR